MGKNSLKPDQLGSDPSPAPHLAGGLREGYLTPPHFLICEMEENNGNCVTVLSSVKYENAHEGHSIDWSAHLENVNKCQ